MLREKNNELKKTEIWTRNTYISWQHSQNKIFLKGYKKTTFSHLNQYHINFSWQINTINISKWEASKTTIETLKLKLKPPFQSGLWCVMLGSGISTHRLGVSPELWCTQLTEIMSTVFSWFCELTNNRGCCYFFLSM